MSVFKELEKRGLVDSTTSDQVGPKVDRSRLTFYVGFDPTADSFHIGQLAIFNLMGLLQKAGHKPIALVGGATGLIGDPGGKSKERNLLSSQQIQNHIAGQKKQLEHFIDFSGDKGALLLDNQNWLGKWGYIDFLRDVGKHFSVNQMMVRDSVKSRLSRDGEGISYTEFSYMLMQAYDFYHLCKDHGCTLQVGGSDQWGNIVSGIDLTRRLHQKEVYGLTMPLVTKSDGSKFGKSEEGTIWLDAKKTSPYQFYQFFIRIEDNDVISLLKMLTSIPLSEIDELETVLQESPHLRQPQKKLAEFLTQRVHGKLALQKAQHATKVLYGGAVDTLDDQTIGEIFSHVPAHQVEAQVLEKGWGLLDALQESGACSSKSQARKLVLSGGVYLNNVQTKEVDLVLTSSHLASTSYLVLRTGKKNYYLIFVNRT